MIHSVPVTEKEKEYYRYSEMISREIAEFRKQVNRYGLKRVWGEALQVLSTPVKEERPLARMLEYLVDGNRVMGIGITAPLHEVGIYSLRVGTVEFSGESVEECVAKAVMSEAFSRPRWERSRELRDAALDENVKANPWK
jgi:hypothetical protein